MLSNIRKKSQKTEDLANCIRFLAIDSVQKAKSGHPGMPMGMADIATILFQKHIELVLHMKILKFMIINWLYNLLFVFNFRFSSMKGK